MKSTDDREKRDLMGPKVTMISLLLPLLGVVLPPRLMNALVVKLCQRQHAKQLLRRMSCDPYLQLSQQQQLPQLDNLQQLG